MHKIWLVFRNEFITVVCRRSFILTLVLMPLIGFIVTMVISGINSKQENNPLVELFAPQTKITMEGYVDPGGLVKDLPQDVRDVLRPYKDESEARRAMEAGEIDAYYLISPDYVASGKIDYVRPDFNPMSGVQQSKLIEYVLNYNLLGGDSLFVSLVQNPYNLEVLQLSEAPQGGEATAEKPQRNPEDPMTFLIPYIVTFLFYIVIMSGATLMLSSITEEKQNQVIEILMTSITPIQMLTGKMIALALVGLLQTMFWSGTGLLLLRLSGQTFNLPVTFQLPVSILIWGGIFFLLGYGIYAGFMAGVGALVPGMREASQVTFVIIIPLIIPLMFISILISQPNGVLAVILSLFPLTSPMVMMTRLAAGSVVWWQMLLSIGLLVATDWFIIHSIAGMFRTQILLSGKEFNLRLFFRVFSGRTV